jgi:hypothetical protein
LSVHYRRQAVLVLGKDQEFAWLADFDAMGQGRPYAWRPTLLTELRKISDPDDMKAVARLVCEARPKSREGVAMIRRIRLGQRPASARDLMHTLARAVNDCMERHPDTTHQQATAAVLNLLHYIGGEDADA